MKSMFFKYLLAFLKRVSPRKVSQGCFWPIETLRTEQVQLRRRVDTWLAAWQAVSAGCDLPGSARFFRAVLVVGRLFAAEQPVPLSERRKERLRIKY
jgi:hypothetical protein